MRYLTNIGFIILAAVTVGMLAAGDQLSTWAQIGWVSFAEGWAGLEWIWKARAR